MHERFELLDVLRGFALIGIVLMNIEWFNRPVAELPRMDPMLTGLDHAAAWFIKIFVEGKFYKLFSLLFGIGFAVMLSRAESEGRAFAAVFLRRMAALFVFGLLHLVLLWGGDILHRYAIGGILMLAWAVLLRRERWRRFDAPNLPLWVGAALLCAPLIFGTVAGFGFGLTHDRGDLDQAWQERLQVEQHAERLLLRDGKAPAVAAVSTLPKIAAPEATVPERVLELGAQRASRLLDRERRAADETQAMTQSSYVQALRYRAADARRHLAEAPGFVLFPLLPIFLIGFWLVRSGALLRSQSHDAMYRLVAWGGLAVGLAMNVAGYTLQMQPTTRLIQPLWQMAFLSQHIGQLVLTAAYFAAFVLLLQKPWAKRRLLWLTPLGRMALTNYLMQSVVLALLFHGYGLGLFGRVSRFEQLGIALGVLVLQWIFSRYWLAHYRHGPVEWLWRCVTYWRWLPLRASPGGPSPMRAGPIPSD